MTYTEWIRVAEIGLMTVTAIAEISVVVGVARHMWLPDTLRRYGRPGRKITGFERRLHNGRAIRALALLLLLVGDIYSLVASLDDPVTVRSVFWTLGTTCAFVSWTLLDRRRWEVGVT